MSRWSGRTATARPDKRNPGLAVSLRRPAIRGQPKKGGDKSVRLPTERAAHPIDPQRTVAASEVKRQVTERRGRNASMKSGAIHHKLRACPKRQRSEQFFPLDRVALCEPLPCPPENLSLLDTAMTVVQRGRDGSLKVVRYSSTTAHSSRVSSRRSDGWLAMVLAMAVSPMVANIRLIPPMEYSGLGRFVDVLCAKSHRADH
jgi:hypothetical protein